MINKLLQLYTDLNIKRRMRRSFSPTKQEIIEARLAYMVEVERQFPFTEQMRSSGWYHYALAAIVGILILNGSAVIYADTVDVPTTHPLYAYKRVAEEVKVRSASSTNKPEVEIKIAQRRIKELKQINTGTALTASSTASTTGSTNTIKSKVKTHNELKKNFQKHMDAAEVEIELERTSNKQFKKEVLCNQLEEVKINLSNVLEDDDRNNIQQKINKFCNSTIQPTEQLRKPNDQKYQEIEIDQHSSKESSSPKIEIKGKSGKNILER